MPSFESPLPYRPNRGTFWPESFFHLRVDELPVHDDSDADITAAAEASPVSTFKSLNIPPSNRRPIPSGFSR